MWSELCGYFGAHWGLTNATLKLVDYTGRITGGLDGYSLKDVPKQTPSKCRELGLVCMRVLPLSHSVELPLAGER